MKNKNFCDFFFPSLIKYGSELNLNLEEIIVLMYVHFFINYEHKTMLSAKILAKQMNVEANKIDKILTSLYETNFIQIDINANNDIIISLDNVKKQLLNALCSNSDSSLWELFHSNFLSNNISEKQKLNFINLNDNKYKEHVAKLINTPYINWLSEKN